MGENKQYPEDQESTIKNTGKVSRREFLRGASLAAGGSAIALTAAGLAQLSGSSEDPVGPETIRTIPETPTIPKDDNLDPLIRMQEELRRAMAKPVEQRQWMMVIDTRKCVGCHACTVACIAENKLPPGVVYRSVATEVWMPYSVRSQHNPIGIPLGAHLIFDRRAGVRWWAYAVCGGNVLAQWQ